MKIKNTPEQINAIVEALRTINERPFTCQSCNPKYNAQRNLGGKSFYFNDNTLKFHKGRVNGSGTLAEGLLFWAECTDALDMHNSKRGHRYVVFDVFGSTVFRPSLEEASTTSAKARKLFESEEIDLAKYYGDVFSAKMTDARQKVANIEIAMDQIDRIERQMKAA